MRTVYFIKPCSPHDAEVSRFIDELDAYQGSLYPAESNHLDSRQTLSQPNCKLLGAYRSKELVGIGAAKIQDGYGELKRFFVPPVERGAGIAELLISAVEVWLVNQQIPVSRLETGIHQKAALRVYEKLGYQRKGPFGDYGEDPLSVFMEKRLPAMPPILANSFFLVGFSSRLNRPAEGYSDVAREILALASSQPGFLGASSTRSEDGAGYTASLWSDLEAIAAWSAHPRHREAQVLGRERFYSSFRTAIGRVEGLSH